MTVPTSHVLMDLENVLGDLGNVGRLAQDCFKCYIFVGAKQTGLPTEAVRHIQPLGSRVQYIQILGTGKNALDFHIAYYLGLLVPKDLSASYFVVTLDAGYDPLLKHLQSQGVSADRVDSVADIQVAATQSFAPVVPVARVPATQAPLAGSLQSPAERMETVVARLRQYKHNKPGKVATLKNSIATWFHRQLPEKEIEKLIQKLVSRRVVSISGTKVTYTLPDEGKAS